jgi:nicotinamidase-related amidase
VQKKVQRLNRTGAGLVVVDIQERLLPAIFEPELVVQETVRLIRGAAVFGLPVFVTEQYRKGLGATVPEIARELQGFTPMQKIGFSACRSDGFMAALSSKRCADVLLCGIETHVCVAQTCLDLLEAGLNVFAVADAVSSRTRENRCIGIERMRDAGAVIVSTEMALFELAGEAGTPEFKQILNLVR